MVVGEIEIGDSINSHSSSSPREDFENAAFFSFGAIASAEGIFIGDMIVLGETAGNGSSSEAPPRPTSFLLCLEISPLISNSDSR